MRVTRNFEELYRTEADPWDIGAADSPRYDLYRRLILGEATTRARVLDIGCGLGAFLARFNGQFDRLMGFELSHEAVDRGSRLHPEIEFVQGSATQLEGSVIDDLAFDAIVCSDVTEYLNDGEKDALLRWIARHLTPDGIALVAAWCPGGKYLTADELRRLVRRHFSISADEVLGSEHAVFVGRPRRRLVAVTVDYETWHPVPVGAQIDWDDTVFGPTATLLDVAEKSGAVLTFMAEVGEYLWLRDNERATADRMAAQWREALDRGHDVQLHLHPSWLPELRPTSTAAGWQFDWSATRLSDYPGDLTDAIRRGVAALRDAVSATAPDHAITCFRAGAYAAQPFARLFDALVANGITCDSSVYRGGVSAERGYDFRLAYSGNQPYFASRSDPQLLAPPAEAGLVELPIFTPAPDRRWLFDGDGSGRLVAPYLAHLARQNGPPTEVYRAMERVGWFVRGVYEHSGSLRPFLNRAVPDVVAELLARYDAPDTVADDYFVMTGHTKGVHDWQELADSLVELGRQGCEFTSLSSMARRAHTELRAGLRDSGVEPAFQVQRERASILSTRRNEQQSRMLQRRIPADRSRVLDLGCGAGYWTTDIGRQLPWAAVVGLDFGEEFLQSGRAEHNDAVAGFLRGDFEHLPFRDGAFDCVYADNVLEHTVDPAHVLREVRRILSARGVLMAAVPSDGRNPGADCDNHIWKTVPRDVEARLLEAGFRNIQLDEVDIRRRMGSSPFPPSRDKMMYVTARCLPKSRDLDRVRDVVDWTYHFLDPARCHTSSDPEAILAGGHAWCDGYALATQHILEHEGIPTRRVDFSIRWHPRGRGPQAVDTHSVLEAHVEGRWHLLDPTCNLVYDSLSMSELVAAPHLGESAVASMPKDARFVERGYAAYCGSFAFERAFDVHYHLPRAGRTAVGLATRASPRLGRRLLGSRAAR